MRSAILTTIISSYYQLHSISSSRSIYISRAGCCWSITITKAPAISHCASRNSRTVSKHKAVAIKALRSCINSKCRSWFRINRYWFRNAIHTTIVRSNYQFNSIRSSSCINISRTSSCWCITITKAPAISYSSCWNTGSICECIGIAIQTLSSSINSKSRSWFRINGYCLRNAILTTIVRSNYQFNGISSSSCIYISRTVSSRSISITKAPAISHCACRNGRSVCKHKTVTIQTLSSSINCKSWRWFRINCYCVRNAIHTTIARSNYQFNGISSSSCINIGRTCWSWCITITKAPAISHCSGRNGRTITESKAIAIQTLSSSINSKCRCWFRINCYCVRNAILTTIIRSYYQFNGISSSSCIYIRRTGCSWSITITKAPAISHSSSRNRRTISKCKAVAIQTLSSSINSKCRSWFRINCYCVRNAILTTIIRTYYQLNGVSASSCIYISRTSCGRSIAITKVPAISHGARWNSRTISKCKAIAIHTLCSSINSKCRCWFRINCYSLRNTILTTIIRSNHQFHSISPRSCIYIGRTSCSWSITITKAPAISHSSCRNGRTISESKAVTIHTLRSCINSKCRSWFRINSYCLSSAILTTIIRSNYQFHSISPRSCIYIGRTSRSWSITITKAPAISHCTCRNSGSIGKCKAITIHTLSSSISSKSWSWFRINCYSLRSAILTTIIRSYYQFYSISSRSCINIGRTGSIWSITITKAPAISYSASRNSRSVGKYKAISIYTLVTCINSKPRSWFRINSYCLRNAILTTIIRSYYQLNGISSRSCINIGRACCGRSITIAKAPAISHCTRRNGRSISERVAIAIHTLSSSINRKSRSWFRINCYWLRNAVLTSIISSYYKLNCICARSCIYISRTGCSWSIAIPKAPAISHSTCRNGRTISESKAVAIYTLSSSVNSKCRSWFRINSYCLSSAILTTIIWSYYQFNSVSSWSSIYIRRTGSSRCITITKAPAISHCASRNSRSVGKHKAITIHTLSSSIYGKSWSWFRINCYCMRNTILTTIICSYHQLHGISSRSSIYISRTCRCRGITITKAPAIRHGTSRNGRTISESKAVTIHTLSSSINSKCRRWFRINCYCLRNAILTTIIRSHNKFHGISTRSSIYISRTGWSRNIAITKAPAISHRSRRNGRSIAESKAVTIHTLCSSINSKRRSWFRINCNRLRNTILTTIIGSYHQLHAISSRSSINVRWTGWCRSITITKAPAISYSTCRYGRSISESKAVTIHTLSSRINSKCRRWFRINCYRLSSAILTTIIASYYQFHSIRTRSWISMCRTGSSRSSSITKVPAISHGTSRNGRTIGKYKAVTIYTLSSSINSKRRRWFRINSNRLGNAILTSIVRCYYQLNCISAGSCIYIRRTGCCRNITITKAPAIRHSTCRNGRTISESKAVTIHTLSSSINSKCRGWFRINRYRLSSAILTTIIRSYYQLNSICTSSSISMCRTDSGGSSSITKVPVIGHGARRNSRSIGKYKAVTIHTLQSSIDSKCRRWFRINRYRISSAIYTTIVRCYNYFYSISTSSSISMCRTGSSRSITITKAPAISHGTRSNSRSICKSIIVAIYTLSSRINSKGRCWLRINRNHFRYRRYRTSLSSNHYHRIFIGSRSRISIGICTRY